MEVANLMEKRILIIEKILVKRKVYLIMISEKEKIKLTIKITIVVTQ